VDVSVVLVGLNACRYIDECIESLRKAQWGDCRYEVIYVDNGSRDGSVEMMRDKHPEVPMIENDRNLGYCPAANQGARIAKGRYLFFLNDDTLVVDDAIAMLVGFLNANPRVGVVGSRLLNLDGTDQWSGRRFPSLLNGMFGRRSTLSRWFPRMPVLRDYLCEEEVRRGVPFAVDWVSAAAELVSQELFWKVGGFAEDYYYWHEAVFCDRVREQGRSVYLHPQSRIVHYEGKGSGARPYRVQRWHIVNFHQGAYRCYCEHYRLSAWNPRRWFAAVALSGRMLLLLAANRLKAGARV
jgi:N-acetylglucosaminyl-diphospho-decaprenol L-rhamnosyltransferase